MGIGAALFLGAVGAILYWGVDREFAGVDIDVIGIILMVVAAIGLIWSLIAASALASRRGVVVEEEPEVVERRRRL